MRLCGHQFGGWMDPPCETGYQGWLQLEKKWAWRCWRVKLMNYKLINLFVLLKKGLICLIPQGCSMDDLGSRNLWSSSKVGRPQTRKWTLQPEHIGDALLDGWVLKNTSQLTLFVCLVPLRFFWYDLVGVMNLIFQLILWSIARLQLTWLHCGSSGHKFVDVWYGIAIGLQRLPSRSVSCILCKVEGCWSNESA